MRATVRRSLIAAVIVGCLAAAAGAGQQKPAGPNATRFGNYTIESQHFQGTIGGAWEFSKGVKVTGPSLTMTCDNLKVWPGKTSSDLEQGRAEATGSVVVRGRYVATDQTEWQVVGSAATGTYDGTKGEGVLQGGVEFHGTNLTTGAVLSVDADKLIYDVKSQQFRFERSNGLVRVKWEEPEQPAKPAPESAPQAGGK